MAVATLVVAGLGVSRVAMTRPDFDAEISHTQRQLEKAKARVAELEERLMHLEQARLAHQARARVEAATTPSQCDEPFVVDSRGIKRWLAHCPYAESTGEAPVVTLAECEEPFRVGRDGIKRVRPECISHFATDRY
jgi:hypothetical protein